MKDKLKKVILLILVVFILTGCVNINDSNIDTIVNTTLNSKYKIYNHFNRGYKYYLPRGLQSKETDDCNEIIKSKYYDYYLYVDLVSYNKKVDNSFNETNNIYYSKKLNDKGILNITKTTDNDYLIQAYYNYAKIEVKVHENDIKSAVSNSLIILSSISFNDDVINKLLDENVLNSIDEEVSVFNIKDSSSNQLEVDDTYTGEDSEAEYDPDVIKK